MPLREAAQQHRINAQAQQIDLLLERQREMEREMEVRTRWYQALSLRLDQAEQGIDTCTEPSSPSSAGSPSLRRCAASEKATSVHDD